MRIRVIKHYSLIITCAIATTVTAQRAAGTQSFATPPDSVKLSVYYYWLDDNISKEGVQKDIEAMAKVGIGRAFIGNIGLAAGGSTNVHTKLFTDEWWTITAHAVKTGTKQGVDIGLFNSPGWSQSGGPWVKPTETMRYLYSQEWLVKGGARLQQNITVSKKDFQSVAVLAFPQPEGDGDNMAMHNPALSSASTTISNLSNAADNNITTVAMFPKGLVDSNIVNIDLSLTEKFTARSLVLHLAEQPMKAMVEIQVNINGTYQTIKQFEVDRSNPALNVGFIPYAPVAIF